MLRDSFLQQIFNVPDHLKYILIFFRKEGDFLMTTPPESVSMGTARESTRKTYEYDLSNWCGWKIAKTNYGGGGGIKFTR